MVVDEKTSVATYISTTGGTGTVRLIGTQNILPFLEQNGVDVSIDREDLNTKALKGLGFAAIPPLILLGIVALFRKNTTIGFGGG